jgi:predicted CXXCH cytochrome family protein
MICPYIFRLAPFLERERYKTEPWRNIMSAKNSINTTISKMFFATSLIAALVCASPVSLLAEERGCTLSLQLRDPNIRAEYDAVIAASRVTSDSGFSRDFSETSTNNDAAGLDSDTFKRKIDSMTFECLTCHDGLSIKSGEVRFSNDKEFKPLDLEKAAGNHPVGMDYRGYASGNPGYKGMESLSRDMILMDGKVGCLSCHNPLNSEKPHLVMDNDRSALCLTCHIK